jgi:hypothetical protein
MCSNIAGSRSINLCQDPRVKLKAVYTFLEQLYAGSLFTIMIVMGHKEPPRVIRDVLKQLSTVPAQIEELKKSAARAGAMLSLSQIWILPRWSAGFQSLTLMAVNSLQQIAPGA